MIELMLDSNVCIRAMRTGGEDVRAWLIAHTDAACLSSIVLHELYVGAELAARREHHRALVDELAAQLAVVDFDATAADHAASIRADLQRRGALIGGNDMLIAGHARSMGLKLITSDLHDFRRIDGLRCEDWLAEGSA
ncbi:MAG: type II toxin-antitoxin system VapC family toxin [Sphingopyxis sp.]